MEIRQLWTLGLLVLCCACSAAATSDPTASEATNATETSITTTSSFQIRYPYSTAMEGLYSEIRECAAVSGFAFRGLPNVWQVSRMCAAPSCGALATNLLERANQAAPGDVVAAFRQFASPMLNFCWYMRLPDEPCPANPLASLASRVKEKDDACAQVLGTSFSEPNGTTFTIAVSMYIVSMTETSRCPTACLQLTDRVYYLYDRMPCRSPNDNDFSQNFIELANGFLFTACNMAKGPYKYQYVYEPDWPTPTVPPEPTTAAPPIEDDASSTDGATERDAGSGSGSDLGDVDTILENGVTVVYRSKMPRPSNSIAASDPESANTPSDDAGTVGEQLGVVSVSTGTGTSKKMNAGADDEPSASASPVSATEARDSSRDYTSSIVVCVVAVVVFVAFLLFVERRRKRQVALQDNKLDTPRDEEEERYSVFTDPLSSFSSSSNLDLVSASSNNVMSSIWGGSGVFLRKTIPLESIKDIRLIGTGGFGVVYLVQDTRSKRLLASKRLIKSQVTSDKIATFYDEIQLVSKLDHPCIVSYVGATWTNRSDLQALFEYMDGGDLRTHLDVTPVAPWSLDKLDIAINIADALVYVHSTLATPIVHRDLKSRNILLSRSPLRAKLSDFGVARKLSHNQSMTTGVGTSRWLAPEVIIGGGEYDATCDIYSLGVVLSELDTHRLPFADCSAGGAGSMLPEITILSMVGLDGLKPTFSESCPPQLLQLAQDCLAYDPKQRPSADDVAATLRSIRMSML